MAKTTPRPEMALPRDEFSEAVRRFHENPGAVKRESTIHLPDAYGNMATWVLTTYREDGKETVLLQRMSNERPVRIVLPPAVCAALARHRDGAVTASRKKTAKRVAAERLAQGIVPAFLKKAVG